jgi:hypothetical protein
VCVADRAPERNTSWVVMSTRTQLRWLRSWYAIRNRIGFDGFRVGSWQHLLHLVLRPRHRMHANRLLRLGLVGLVWLVALVGSVLAGVSLLRGAVLATVVLSAVWFAIALGVFVAEVVQSRSQRPPYWRPPDAGAREPRGPAPNLDAGAIRLDLPDVADS